MQQYELEKRLTVFSASLIRSLKAIPITRYNQNIIDQLLRSGTSIGANYHEANGAVSRNDFRNKIGICKKEALEAKYWLSLLGNSELGHKVTIEALSNEFFEYVKIFTKILQTLRNSV
ncbi:MAG: four helix bundle protein [Patescibacteria group bacterium]